MINCIIKRKKGDSIIDTINRKTVSHPQAISNAFNDFFVCVNIGLRLQATFPPVNILIQMVIIAILILSMYVSYTNKYEVLRTINSLQNHNHPGHDEIFFKAYQGNISRNF